MRSDAKTTVFLATALLSAVAARAAAPPPVVPPLGPGGRVCRALPLKPGEASAPRLSRGTVDALASRQSIEAARRRLEERVRRSVAAAKAMRYATEKSVAGGDDVGRKMLQAGVAPDQVDFAMRQISSAVPRMREAGREIERELEKEEASAR